MVRDETPGALEAIARRPRLAALLGAMCIAFSGIFYRYAAVSPSTGTVFRCLFGLPILLGIALVERRRFGPLPLATVRLAAIAGVFFALDLTFWHHAIEAVGAGLATVLGNLQVLVVGLVAWAALGERPPRPTLVAVPIVLAGVALIAGVGGGAYGKSPVAGVVLGLLTALCYAGYLMVIRQGGRDLRRPAGPVAVATAATAATAVLIGLLVGDLDPAPSPTSLAWLGLLGITSQSAGYLLISLSLPRLPAVLTSIILLVQPIATVGLSMVLLGEAPSPAQLAGVALVVGGIAVATLGGRPADRRAAALRPTDPPGAVRLTTMGAMSAPRILVSNDDGYVSEGLGALVDAIAPLGEVWVVAPEAEQSASSHAISIHRPLRIREVRQRWYAIDGTPTDCSYIAINHLMKDGRPQLMLSGINHGPNLADDVTYSGTVAAAMEASILGVPAIAFSLVSRGPMNFAPAARFAARLAEAALGQELPANLLLNVNVPGGVEPTSWAVTRLGKHSYGFEVVEKVDPRGRKYYWIGGNEYQHDDIPGSDCNAVLRDGIVSVTPLHVALTANEMRPLVERWPVREFTQARPVDPR